MEKEPDFSQPNNAGLRFDRTFNAGHVLTAIMMGAALVTMWANSKVVEAAHAARIETSEKSIVELQQTTRSLADSQQQMVRTQDKLTLTLEYLAKQSAKP